jgi:hypothetical protein
MGEEAQADYAGKTMQIIDPSTGKIAHARTIIPPIQMAVNRSCKVLTIVGINNCGFIKILFFCDW